jgi:hypothetical protein
VQGNSHSSKKKSLKSGLEHQRICIHLLFFMEGEGTIEAGSGNAPVSDAIGRVG